MSEKYIRKNKSSYVVNKSGKNYGKFHTLDDAIFAREILISNDWNLSYIEDVYKNDEEYIITSTLDDKIHFIARYRKMPSDDKITHHQKKFIRNPNNSKYGLNISKIFETFLIRKRIAGDDYIFGYYDNQQDAEFVRNHLMDHMWDVGIFSKVMYDEDADNYKIVEVIDDKVYVIDTYDSESEIDAEKSHEKFLIKISKHKHGLASHPYLDELRDKIANLEEAFGVSVSDENWNLEDVSNPLEDIIFNLTPFQKSVYDSIDNSTIGDVEMSLKRFRSKNFTDKIQRNLDELLEADLISKNGNLYNKK